MLSLAGTRSVLSAQGTGALARSVRSSRPFAPVPGLTQSGRRKIHIAFQGTGGPADLESTPRAMSEAYQGPNKLVLGGPGNLVSTPLHRIPSQLMTGSGWQERVTLAREAVKKAK